MASKNSPKAVSVKMKKRNWEWASSYYNKKHSNSNKENEQNGYKLGGKYICKFYK